MKIGPVDVEMIGLTEISKTKNPFACASRSSGRLIRLRILTAVKPKITQVVTCAQTLKNEKGIKDKIKSKKKTYMLRSIGKS